MGIFAKEATSIDLEENGVWVDVGGGDRVKIKRGGPFNKGLQGAIAEHSLDKIQNDLGLMIDIYAKHLICDLDIEDFDGSKMEFTDENIYRVLRVSKIFEIISEKCMQDDTFREKKVKNAVKK